jgi:hypothetical protein
MFRERLDERRTRDEAAGAGRASRGGPGPTVEPATPAAPRRGAVEDDDDFYRPRSWLV